MTTKTFRAGAAALALVAMAQPQFAMAQECIEQQDLTDGVIYAMPLFAEAVRDKCSSELSANGFFAREGDAFVTPYRALQSQTWPAATRLLMIFAQSGEEEDGDDEFGMLLQSLPEDAVRPFVDAIIVQKVGEEIKLDDCSKIERGMELLAPLPPKNTGGLLTFVFDLAGVDNPQLCPYREE